MTTSGAVAAYNQRVQSDPAEALAQAAWLSEELRQKGVLYDGAPMQSFLRPHFVARGDWLRLRDVGRRLLELAARVARQAFGGDAGRLCAYLGTPQAEA